MIFDIIKRWVSPQSVDANVEFTLLHEGGNTGDQFVMAYCDSRFGTSYERTCSVRQLKLYDQYGGCDRTEEMDIAYANATNDVYADFCCYAVEYLGRKGVTVVNFYGEAMEHGITHLPKDVE